MGEVIEFKERWLSQIEALRVKKKNVFSACMYTQKILLLIVEKKNENKILQLFT